MSGYVAWKSNITAAIERGSLRLPIDIPESGVTSPFRIGSSVYDQLSLVLSHTFAQMSSSQRESVVLIHITIYLSMEQIRLHIGASANHGVVIEGTCTLGSSHQVLWFRLLTAGKEVPIMSSRTLRNIYSKLIPELEHQLAMEKPKYFSVSRPKDGKYSFTISSE